MISADQKNDNDDDLLLQPKRPISNHIFQDASLFKGESTPQRSSVVVKFRALRALI
jgi:hypothetical protein